MPRLTPLSEKQKSELDKVMGAEVRRLRRAKDMTQAELGKADEVSFQQVQKYENGTNAMRVSTLLNFCKALDVDPRIFLGRCVPKVEK